MRITPVLFEPLFTLGEFAAELGVSRQTVSRWVAEGYAVPAKRAGRRGVCVFTGAELERLRCTPRPRRPRARLAFDADAVERGLADGPVTTAVSGVSS